MRIRQDGHARDQVTLDLDYGAMHASITFTASGIGMQDPEGDAEAARVEATKLLQGLARAIGDNVPGRVNWAGI